MKNDARPSSYSHGAYVAAALIAVLSANCADVEPDSDIESVGVASNALAAATPLKPRRAADKPAHTKLDERVKHDQIVVKFAEGSRVRLVSGGLNLDATRISASHAALLQRAGLDTTRAAVALSDIDKVLGSEPSAKLARANTVSDAELEQLHDQGEALSGDELADLALYYTVDVAPERSEALIDELNASPLVEIAYPTPIAFNAAMDIAPTTPSFEAEQTYFEAPPNGIDMRYSWNQPSGAGAGRHVMDVERDFNFSHEDLPTRWMTLGTGSTVQGDIDHGTAVAGIIVGAFNAYGVRGGANGVQYGTSSNNATTVAAAITSASNALSNGDVLLIEQQFFGPSSGLTCPPIAGCAMTCPPSANTQFEMVPVEWVQGEYDAIHTATANGRVVIEPAANGAMNLDSAIYNNGSGQNTFTSRDSGAIMVGAGIPTTLQPHCWTNFGARVNIQNWGSAITTLGYGDVQVNGMDQNQWYTRTFGGTSGASAITAAAAAGLQGAFVASGVAPINSATMRFAMYLHGTPQPTPVTQQIGPRPDLRCTFKPGQPTAYNKLAAIRQSTNITALLAGSCSKALPVRSVSAGTWSGPTSLPGASITPRGATVALAPWSTNRVAAFVVTTDGTLRYYYEENDGAWQGPFSLSAAGFAPPGARIATGTQGTNQLDVFVVANGGAINMFKVTGTGTWSSANAITSSGFAAAGAPLATGKQGTNQLDLFVVTTNGTLKVLFATGTGSFGSASSISSSGVFPASAPIATGAQGTNQLDVFGIGADGRLKAYWVVGTGFWNGPTNLSTAIATTGTEVTTATWPSNQLNVFFMSSGGAVQWSRVVGTGSWSGPNAVTSGFFAYPSASIAAATEGSTKLDLFVVANAGLSRASATSASGPFSSFTVMP